MTSEPSCELRHVIDEIRLNCFADSGLKILSTEGGTGSDQTITFSYKSQAQGKQTKTPIRVGRSPMAKGDQIERNLDGERQWQEVEIMAQEVHIIILPGT